MALTQRLELRQGQSLVMTPQLQQAIKLLQMSNLELQAFVEAELEKNPLLERDEKPRGRKRSRKRRRSRARRRERPERRQRAPSSGSTRSIPISTMSIRMNRAPMPPTGRGVGHGGFRLGVAQAIARRVARPGRSRYRRHSQSREKTLAEHLTEQLDAGDRRSGRPADRPESHRHGERGGLSHRRPRHRGRDAGDRAPTMSSACSAFSRASIRPVSSPAISRNA